MENYKLLKFAGFTYYNNPAIFGGKIQKTGWYTPDNCKCRRPPNFEKVDNCIKWLLPKIKDLDGINFYPKANGDGFYWNVYVAGQKYPHEGDSLAEAIEKYVDWVQDTEIESEEF